MIFFALAVFLPSLWFFPWWAQPLIYFSLGLGLMKTWSLQMQTALAAGASAAVLSFVRDGQSYGLISRRMAPLIGLPQPILIFVLMGVLTFVFSLLWLRTGALLRQKLSS